MKFENSWLPEENHILKVCLIHIFFKFYCCQFNGGAKIVMWN